jgi:hypothetical protein
MGVHQPASALGMLFVSSWMTIHQLLHCLEFANKRECDDVFFFRCGLCEKLASFAFLPENFKQQGLTPIASAEVCKHKYGEEMAAIGEQPRRAERLHIGTGPGRFQALLPRHFQP